MEPFINLEETLGKVVGRRRRPSNPLDPTTHSKAYARSWKRAFPEVGLPRGAFRFESHEEADEWKLRMLARIRTPTPER